MGGGVVPPGLVTVMMSVMQTVFSVTGMPGVASTAPLRAMPMDVVEVLGPVMLNWVKSGRN